MHAEEVGIIESYLKKEDTVLEIGSGGSTLRFSKQVKTYVSIEHDPKWYGKVLGDISSGSYDNVKYYLAKDEKDDLPYTRYLSMVEKLLKEYRPSKILVDGRVRVECCRLIYKYAEERTIIFFHDWHLEHFHSMLDDMFDLVEVSPRNTFENPVRPQGLAVLKKKVKSPKSHPADAVC
jgi:hypothetical protein